MEARPDELGISEDRPPRYWLRAERQSANVIKIDKLEGLFNLGRALAQMESAMNVRLTARDGSMVNAYFSSNVRNALADFYGDLALELGGLPVYFATQKRGYDRDVLINAAEELLDESDRVFLSPFTVTDLRKAGACLMFDLFTACGFHAGRAVETVARRYYELVFAQVAARAGKHGPEPLGLGALAMELSDRFTNLKKAKTETGLLGLIATTLERIARIYRNPIMHPEVVLNEKDAIRIFNETINAISTTIDDVRTGGPHFSSLHAYLTLRP